jgi:undecaprenyl diphosphate synthase
MNTAIPEENKLKHVVIISDGDRRWAKLHGVPAWEGHRRGADNIRNLLEVCKEEGIPYLTMWGFSTDNWKRDKDEVAHLLDIILQGLKKEHKSAIKNGVRFRQLGRRDRLPQNLITEIEATEADTKDFTEWNFQAALDYGGQDEIVRATKKIAADVKSGKLDIDSIDEKLVYSYLDSADLPYPDLIIRTSGEQRLSGMLPFQGVYAELVFSEVLFPDFGKKEFKKVIQEFYTRNRRFGGK